MKTQFTEQSIRVCILKNVICLSIFLEQFRKSVALLDLLQRTDPPLEVLRNDYFAYQMIAAREGALNIFHFKCCLEAIKKQLPRSKSLSSLVNSVRIREILKQFLIFFPHTDNVPHGIAHAGEIFKSAEVMKQHGMRVPRYGPGFAVDEGGYLLSALNDRTYSVGSHGEVFSVTLDQAAISNLRNVLSLVQEAFQLALKASPIQHDS